MTKKKYQDYVIKKGQFIGDFENMYKDCEDPWHQSTEDNVYNSRMIIIKNWIKKINTTDKVQVCEIGCGFGYITSDLNNEGVSCVGVDISSTAIKKARSLHNNCDFTVTSFDDFKFYKQKNINIFMMTEVTWYVLPKLKTFLEKLKEYRKNYGRPVYLIHLLTTYPEGVQQYGKDYFFDLKGILKFFELDYIEYGSVGVGQDYKSQSRGTYFIAKI